jgi:hypothetical protein
LAINDHLNWSGLAAGAYISFLRAFGGNLSRRKINQKKKRKKRGSWKAETYDKRGITRSTFWPFFKSPWIMDLREPLPALPVASLQA